MFFFFFFSKGMRSCGVGGVHPLASVRASHFALSQSVHGDKLSRAIGYGVCTYKSSLYRRNITTAGPIPLLRPEDFLFWALSVSLFSPPPPPLLFSLPFFYHTPFPSSFFLLFPGTSSIRLPAAAISSHSHTRQRRENPQLCGKWLPNPQAV